MNSDALSSKEDEAEPLLEVIVDDNINAASIPFIDMARLVATACLVAGYQAAPMLCIRFTDDAQMRLLNSQWRAIDKVTDVLSFPMQDGEVIDMAESLGDIALALPFVRQEAERLELPLRAHMSHLIIHATLHLLGYDHIDDIEAAEMQQLERLAMQQLGLHEPYPESAL
ncbi:MAG: rRNA maturation RNase YbeY [Mariprofundus sp.]|nr:rRNA maturation RNase YbeY [Mariprofundus sp.]